MTVKGSGKSPSPKRPSSSGGAKRTSRSAVISSPSPKTISDKPDVKPRVGGSGRRPLGMVGCVIVLLILCCIATLVLLWFTGDTLLEVLQDFIPQ